MTQTKAKFTPGPWTVEKFTLVVNHEIRQRIADVCGRNAEERAENARLIAQAPAMYDCLKTLVEYYGAGYHTEEWDKACAILRAVDGE